MLHVADHCIPCCVLLDVVACCWELLHPHTTANTDGATPLPTLLTQQCWELLLRPFARIFSDQLRQNFPQRQGVYLDECFFVVVVLFSFLFVKAKCKYWRIDEVNSGDGYCSKMSSSWKWPFEISDTHRIVSLNFSRSRHNTSVTSTYLELLASITNYLATTEQSFGLSHDRVVSLLCLWSASFDETMFLNRLLSSLKFSQGWDSSSSKNSPRADSDYRKAKTDSLSSLLTILTKWKPSPGEGGNQTVLLVWWFGLACSAKSYIDQETDNVCFQSGNNDTEHRLLSLLRWFRKCVLRDRELQDHLIHNLTTGKTLILQLYHVVLSHNKVGLLQNAEGRRIFSYELINEVNVICLVLFAAVQRILKQKTERPTSSQPAIFQLVSQEPYSNIISEGLEKVILRLLPDPRGEMEQGNCLPEQGG